MSKQTELAWNPYISILEMVILESKFNRRAEIKPMATPKGAGESHLTSRALHQRIAAEVIKTIAKELNLNEDYAYIGMLLHDAGHPFSAHEGEEIFNILGRVYNTGFYHHNAKGVEVILSEDICDKAINMIPGIDEKPGLRKKLEEEFYYFLDIVISHDGEATKKDLKKEADLYSNIKDAVLTKLSKSNSKNEYRFIAQTDEGKLGKIADVLAYVPTDIQDGFRLGIIDRFDDEYLEVFGAMLSEKENLSKEEKIKIAKDRIDQIRCDRMRENRKDMLEPENKKILALTREILDEARKEKINIFALTDRDRIILDDMLERKIADLTKSQIFKNDEEKQIFLADMSKFREFTTKMTNTGTDVVADVTSIMRQYFINDFIKTSKQIGKLEFSKKAEDLFYRVKKLNYDKIVMYTKWDYQTNQQPKAAKELVDVVAENLIKSGVIRDKLYDESIRHRVKRENEEAFNHMVVTTQRDESEYTEYRRKIKGKKSIDCIKDNDEKKLKLLTRIKKHFISVKNEVKEKRTFKDKAQTILCCFKGISLKQLYRNELFRNAIQHVRKEGENFAIKYLNVYNAIPYTIKENVEWALKDDYYQKDLLQDFQIKNNKKLQNRMIKEYGSLEEARIRKDEFINLLIEEERKKMEEKMAKQLAIDYLSGMTDRSFNDVAIKTGFMKYKDVNLAKRSSKPSQSVIVNSKALEDATKEEENTQKEETGEERE